MADHSTERRRRIAVAPQSLPAMHDAFVTAVERAGGLVVPIEEASALMWADPAAAAEFPGIAEQGQALEWVQLPYAGVETFLDHLDPALIWTCGKGVYARPVAEMALTLALAGLRDLPTFIGARSWPARTGRNLIGARVTILGGGGIAVELLRLLEPFDCATTVVRRQPDLLPGATRTVTPDRLLEVAAETDVLVIAWALTSETEGRIDAELLAALPNDAWIVNVGRGAHVVTDDLVAALADGVIGGAALDVTDPEPLPDDHPLFLAPNCIVTPHVGNTAEMGLPLIAARVGENVERWLAQQPLTGQVNVSLGY